MSDSYFCWIRVVKVTEGVKRAGGDAVAVTSIERGPFFGLPGGRPPPAEQQRMATSSTNDASPVGTWSAEDAYMGRDLSDTAFDYGPAFQDPADARRWITTREGQEWDRQAVNRMLMRFELSSEKKAPVIPSTPEDSDKPKPPPTGGEFSPADWAPSLRHHYLDGKDTSGPFTFFGYPIALQPPSKMRAAGEDDRLLALQSLRSQREAAIREEATSGFAVAARLLGVVGLSAEDPVGEHLRQACLAVMLAVNGPVFELKAHYRRLRPWDVINGLVPMFGEDELFYPRHPAYPAGHATLARVLAHLLAARHPAQQAALMEVAREIGENREIAGLHYPSDTRAGEALGDQIAEVLLKPRDPNPDLKLLRAVLVLGGLLADD